MNEKPMISTLSTWRELVFSREKLLPRPDPSSIALGELEAPASESADLIQFRLYKDFILDVCERDMSVRQGLVGSSSILKARVTYPIPIAVVVLIVTSITGAFYRGNLKNLHKASGTTPAPPQTTCIPARITGCPLWSVNGPICPQDDGKCDGGIMKVQCHANGSWSILPPPCDSIEHLQSLVAAWRIPFFLCLGLLLIFTTLAIFNCFWLTNCFGLRRRRGPYLLPPTGDIPETVRLVDGLCSRQGSIAHDKAFAVRAVIQRISPTANFSTPNYSTPIGSVYKELCVQLLNATDSIRMLIPAAIHGCQGQPSWVADWSGEFPSFWLNPNLSGLRVPNATPGSRPFWSLSARNGDILRVRGHQLCTIANLYRFRPTSDAYQDNERDMHLENILAVRDFVRTCVNIGLDEAITLLGDPREFGDSPHLSYGRVFSWYSLFGILARESPEDILALLRSDRNFVTLKLAMVPMVRRAFRDIFRTHIVVCNLLAKGGRSVLVTNAVHNCPKRPPSTKLLPSRFFLSSGSSPSNEWVQRWRSRVLDEGRERASRGSRLRQDTSSSSNWLLSAASIYGNGRTVGLCSGDVLEGDRLVLLSGLTLPVILRQDESSTRLVGVAMVYHIMEGQGWDPSWQERDLEEFFLS